MNAFEGYIKINVESLSVKELEVLVCQTQQQLDPVRVEELFSSRPTISIKIRQPKVLAEVLRVKMIKIKRICDPPMN